VGTVDKQKISGLQFLEDIGIDVFQRLPYHPITNLVNFHTGKRINRRYMSRQSILLDGAAGKFCRVPGSNLDQPIRPKFDEHAIKSDSVEAAEKPLRTPTWFGRHR
jgi:hypothetical protein